MKVRVGYFTQYIKSQMPNTTVSAKLMVPAHARFVCLVCMYRLWHKKTMLRIILIKVI